MKAIADKALIYPVDPKQLPKELAGVEWPPKNGALRRQEERAWSPLISAGFQSNGYAVSSAPICSVLNEFPQRQGQQNEEGADHATLSHFREIEEDDDRRIADGRVMAGEGQAARFAIHAEDGDVVAALVARVKELARGVEVEAARVVPACPFLAREGQLAVFADGEDPNAVVQAVAPHRRTGHRRRPGSRSRNYCRRIRAAGWR